jgi:hypothetical protein
MILKSVIWFSRSSVGTHMKSECGYRPDDGAETLVYIPGSHAPAWEPIPVLSSATVCIPTQERGNEAVLSNGLPLDAASPWLTGETGGF